MIDLKKETEVCPYCKRELGENSMPQTYTQLKGTEYKTHLEDVIIYRYCINCCINWVWDWESKTFKEVQI